MKMNDKNCGTCCCRTIETQKERFHDYRIPSKTNIVYEVVEIIPVVGWFCNNSESDNYMKEVSDPHGYCDAWEG